MRLIPILLAQLAFAGAPGDVWATWTSPRFREIQARLAALEAESGKLPRFSPAPLSGFAWGYHSLPQASSGDPIEIMIDLGGVYVLDAVALIPVPVPQANGPVEGYSFPRRLRIAIAEDELFQDPTIIADFTGRDFPYPGAYPAWIPALQARGRYLRLTCFDVWKRDRGMISLALGEIAAFSGGRNVAFAKQVRNSPGGAGGGFWSPNFLVDRRTNLGPPVSQEPSPTEGYIAPNSLVPHVDHWIEVDLGATYPVEEVRLYPARPKNWPDYPSFGFPARFEVTLSGKPNDPKAIRIYRHTDSDLPPPAANTVALPIHSPARGRYLRFRALQLRSRYAKRHPFALAEIEVYSEGRNVAAGRAATASEEVPASQRKKWSLAALTDGFDSRHRLIAEDEWLRGLARQGEIAATSHSLRDELISTREFSVRIGLYVLTFLTAALAAFSLISILRSRRAREAQLKELQARLARDLHDDIGSNLASIALLSAEARRASPDVARFDLAEIESVARETADSMRDIVWLMKSGHTPVPDLVARMRQIASRSLRGRVYNFHASQEETTQRLPLETCRHFLLAFKEAVHNAARHSRADTVSIRVEAGATRLIFRLEDNGAGFTQGLESGSGLKNLEDRAKALGGAVTIASEPGLGTWIEFRSGEVA